jgi:hypothetical protein
VSDPEAEIAELSNLIDGVLPGARRYAPMVGTYGFGISSGGGLSLAATSPSDNWCLTLTAGIVHSVGDINSALWWINERNSNDNLGRFYGSIPGEGPTRCNIVYQTALFVSLFQADVYVAREYAAQLLHLVADTAENVPEQALENLKGQTFSDDEAGMALLVAASFG